MSFTSESCPEGGQRKSAKGHSISPFHSIPFHPSCPDSPSSAKHWQEPPDSELRASSSELAPGRACAPSSWGLGGPKQLCHVSPPAFWDLSSGFVVKQRKQLISPASWLQLCDLFRSRLAGGSTRRSNISSLEPSPASAPYLQRSTGRASSGTRAPGTRKVTGTKAD